MNGLTDLLVNLKKIFKGKFIIPKDVKYEIIDRPLTIKKFKLEALKLKKLLDDKILEMPSSIKISEQEIKEKSEEILRKSNSSYFTKGNFMHIIDKGESSCLALNIIAKEKGFESVIVVDERTTRMIGEAPENLRKLFESKLHSKIELKKDFSFLQNIKFIRSSELVYVGYKKNLTNLKNGNVLEALLYATKYKGCAISFNEIEKAKRF